MIVVTHGNILLAKADALVVPVNAVGVMGAGLAKDFKKEFPTLFYHYEKACKDGKLKPGGVWVWYPNYDAPIIICLATKDHWKYPSYMSFIENGLKALRQWCEHCPDKSVAVPAIGCGFGGLGWEAVRPRIIKFLHDLPNEILMYEPFDSKI